MAAQATSEWVVLDGAEGGGQMLRTALTLSLLTGRPFRIENIRGRRRPPGLRPQHLACVRGAEAISGGRSEGAQVDAPVLTFFPGQVEPGEYLLEVGTAGSTPLLFQCLYFPLALAGGGELTLRGGTHVAHSPSFQYLHWVWLPMLERYGLGAKLQLRYAGFYPEGAGDWRASIPERGPAPAGIDLLARGTLRTVEVTSLVAGLPFEIAERQARAAVGALRERGIYTHAQNLPLPTTRSQGTAVFIRAEFEHSVAGFTALGERGKRAEVVGREAAEQLSVFMESGGAIDEHLGDQILLPAGLLAAGLLGEPAPTRFRTAAVTAHLESNARVIERFLPVAIAIAPDGEVAVRRRDP